MIPGMNQALARSIPRILKSRFVSSVAWMTVDTLASRGATLLVMLIVARLVGAPSFGELTAVLSTLTLFSALVAESMRVTAIKQVASVDLADTRGASRVFGLTAMVAVAASVGASALLWFLASPLARDLLNAPHLATGLRWGAGLILVDILGTAQRGVLTGLGAMRSMALASVFSGLTAAGLVIVLGRGADVSTYVLLFTAASAAGTLVRGFDIWSRMRAHRIRFSLRLYASELAILWHFSLPAMLNSLTWFPVNWIGMTLLANEPDGFREIGFLGIANQWFACLLFLPNIVANTLLPSLSRAYTMNSPQSVSTKLRLCIKSNLMLSIPFAIIIATLSPWIVRDIYGPSFADGALTLCLVVVAAIPASLQNLLGYVLAAKDGMWMAFQAGCVWAIVYLAGAYVGIELGWGANALALAMVYAYTVKLGAQIWQLRRSYSANAAALKTSEV